MSINSEIIRINNNLQVKLDANANAINNETTNRQNADDILQTKINLKANSSEVLKNNGNQTITNGDLTVGTNNRLFQAGQQVLRYTVSGSTLNLYTT